MISDGLKNAGTSPIDCDVCVVGAGAAGISLALELDGSRARVCVLESGGLESDSRTQSLSQGPSVGRPHSPLDTCRSRRFGGSTAVWEGWCSELDDLDFGHQPPDGLGTWPFDKSELAAYYDRARDTCALSHSAPPADHAELPSFHTHWFEMSPPLRFGEAYDNRLRSSDNVHVVLRANVTELSMNDNGSVYRIRACGIDGGQLEIQPRRVVLATGGIENPRLLLAAVRFDSGAAGFPNEALGRYFSEHPHLRLGTLLCRSGTFDSGRYDPVDATAPIATLALKHTHLDPASPAQAACRFVRRPRTNAIQLRLQESAAYRATRRVRHSIRNRDYHALPKALLRATRALASPLGQQTSAIPAVSEIYDVHAFWEQQPNAASRVRLDTTSDALGMPRARLDWRLTGHDVRQVERLRAVLEADLAATHSGALVAASWSIDTQWHRDIFAGNHHIGATRMHLDSRLGVVDADCRVHGTTNLFVAGASVFPRAGLANPTLTIVALSIRLADHLRGLFGFR